MVTLSHPPQGKVHLELRLSEVITDNGGVCHKLATR
ncbi:ras GTPase-activating protein 3, partial [Tachysurus ichikawai]